MPNVNVRVDEDDLARLDAMSVERKSSRSDLIRGLIRADVAPASEPSGEVASRAELLVVLTERARAGNVTAAKALLEELRREDDGRAKQPGTTGSALDQITRLRVVS